MIGAAASTDTGTDTCSFKHSREYDSSMGMEEWGEPECDL